MIKITTGAPGNGKSLLVQSETIEEYLAGERDIVTSTPVRIEPWVTGDGRAMLGLREFLRTECKQTELPGTVRLAPGVVSFGRMLVVEDEEQLGELFLWRRDKQTGEWFKMRWDSEGEQFNQEDLSRMRGGCLVVTDEAWKCYNSRRWKDTEKVVEFYGRQHRKFSDDWVIVSHSHKDLDVQLNRMTQAWRICMNYGLRRLGVFRQPPLFEVKTFYEAPSSASVRCFHSQVRRLNPKVCQTYDTSAGVAIGGSRAADVTRRKPGLSMWWVLVGAVVGLLGLYYLHKLGTWAMVRPFQKGKPKVEAVPEAPRSKAVPAEEKTKTAGGVAAAGAVVTNAPVADMTGYSVVPKLYAGQIIGKKITVELSDGRRFRSGDGHLQYLCEDFCVVDGHTNWYHPVIESNTPALVPSMPVASMSQAVPVGEEPGSTVYVIPYHQNTMAKPVVRDVLDGRY